MLFKKGLIKRINFGHRLLPMEFGICLLSLVPVRSAPSDKAEMVSQLVFGDLVAVTKTTDNWIHVRIIFDNYEGWVDGKQITFINKHEFERLSNATPRYIKDVVEVIRDVKNNTFIPVVLGTSIYNIAESVFQIANKNYSFEGGLSQENSSINAGSLIETAMLFLNAPYLWGGKTPFGTDCSGFTQTVFKLNNIKLHRDASQQSTQGEVIGLLDESHSGDLLFFDNAEGTIVHVGIYLGGFKIIHASGKVRIDTIDHQGIYNDELKKYTHNLRLIKRIL